MEKSGGGVMAAFMATLRLALFVFAAMEAYNIRMYAINTYGRLIHEFDPWFNFHATRYLFENGLKKFFTWFDHTSWYPLGRPVGTTIYPGMQLTSVGIWHALTHLGTPMSLNDICVFVPCWFGAIATVVTGFLAAECSGSKNAGPAAALVMATVPAHIMRSVGGGYDNESIAVTAMVATFYFWVRSLRSNGSWPFGILAGLAYVYMVAAWGGYIFVINMVGVHATLLLALECFAPQAIKDLYGELNFTNAMKSYTLFFIIGTLGAVQVPVVGLTPLRSMEQIGPLMVFAAYQVLGLIEILRRSKGYAAGSEDARKLRSQVFAVVGGAIGVAVLLLLQTGHFGPLSIRVRGLFIQHTKTGNPLVDSVAEHQPATKSAYWQYLHHMCTFAPLGFFFCFYKINNRKLFLILWGLLSYFFSSKMNRLIILMGPVASALAGVFIGNAVDFVMAQAKMLVTESFDKGEEGAKADADPDDKSAATKAAKAKAKGMKKSRNASSPGLVELDALTQKIGTAYNSSPGRVGRVALATLLVFWVPYYLFSFYGYCHMFAEATSQPSIVFQAQLPGGKRIIVNDYLDTYNWINENTPEDARVLSWWDYGYQLSGIANRTTLADGNTWNLEHISLIARCLTSNEKKGHNIIKHLADYVLVWAGGGGDDLAKLPHIARIGNSVYPDICPNDPLCRNFGFYDKQRTPTPKVAASIVYKMVEHGNKPGVEVNEKYFKEVYTSKYGKARVFEVQKVSKKSKKWLADPANRLCDAPGSWYCPGQYPPDLPEQVGQSHANLDYAAHGPP